MSDNQGDIIEVGDVISSSGIAIGAGAVSNVVNVHFGGVLPALDLHALRGQLVARGAPPEALATIDGALASLPDAEAAYRRMLCRAYGEWRDLFVELDMHADEVGRDRERPAAIWMPPELRAVQHTGPGQVERVKLGNLAEALGRYPAVALLGEPGGGKTTALQHLAGELAQDDEDRLPLLVNLARYRHDDLLPFIAEAWPATLAQSPALGGDRKAARTVTDLLLAHLEGYLKAGRLVVLFDALNEMPREAGYSRRREMLRSFIDRWQEQGNRFAVSCRVLDYTGGELSGLPQVEIERLPVERVGQALVAYLPDKGPELWQQLQRAEHGPLLDLVRTPYFLTMLARIYYESDTPPTLPVGRAALLERFTTTLLEREVRKGHPDWIEAPVQRTALGELAYEMQLEGQGGASGTAIPLTQARAYLPQRVTVSGRQWDIAPDVLLRLAAAASLVQIGLDERGNWRDARFWHQLLQEYFAAGELERRFAAGEELAALWRWPYWLESEMPRWEWPKDNWDPMPPPPGSRWEETTVLLAGLSGDPSRLVEAILEANPVLAGRCLAESGALVDEAVRSRVQEALLKTMRDVEVALRVRIAAGNVLGEVGDPRFSGPYLLPEFITIPAGPFMMGSDEGLPREKPVHEVVLGEYAIARYPVTNAQYAVFVQATGRRPLIYFQGNRPGKGSHPIVDVSWHDAAAYCEWLSHETGLTVRLPSEAEWEKAARGGLQIPNPQNPGELVDNPVPRRWYPWEETTVGIFFPNGAGPYYGMEEMAGYVCEWNKCNTRELSVRDTTPVGIFPHGASPYGAEEMAGNVSEWTRSLWGQDWNEPSFKYPYDPADGREDLGAEGARVLRGGSFLFSLHLARCHVRGKDGPDGRYWDRSFRLVVSPISPTSALLGGLGPQPRSGAISGREKGDQR